MSASVNSAKNILKENHTTLTFGGGNQPPFCEDAFQTSPDPSNLYSRRFEQTEWHLLTIQGICTITGEIYFVFLKFEVLCKFGCMGFGVLGPHVGPLAALASVGPQSRSQKQDAADGAPAQKSLKKMRLGEISKDSVVTSPHLPLDPILNPFSQLKCPLPWKTDETANKSLEHFKAPTHPPPSSLWSWHGNPAHQRMNPPSFPQEKYVS